MIKTRLRSTVMNNVQNYNNDNSLLPSLGISYISEVNHSLTVSTVSQEEISTSSLHITEHSVFLI